MSKNPFETNDKVMTRIALTAAVAGLALNQAFPAKPVSDERAVPYGAQQSEQAPSAPFGYLKHDSRIVQPGESATSLVEETNPGISQSNPAIAEQLVDVVEAQDENGVPDPGDHVGVPVVPTIQDQNESRGPDVRVG